MLCGTLYVSRIVGTQDQAQGGSIFNTITQLGSALVLAVTTIVSDSVSNKEAANLGVIVHGNRDVTTVIPKEAILKGYRAAFCEYLHLVLFNLTIKALSTPLHVFQGCVSHSCASPVLSRCCSCEIWEWSVRRKPRRWLSPRKKGYLWKNLSRSKRATRNKHSSTL